MESSRVAGSSVEPAPKRRQGTRASGIGLHAPQTSGLANKRMHLTVGRPAVATAGSCSHPPAGDAQRSRDNSRGRASGKSGPSPSTRTCRLAPTRSYITALGPSGTMKPGPGSDPTQPTESRRVPGASVTDSCSGRWSRTSGETPAPKSRQGIRTSECWLHTPQRSRLANKRMHLTVGGVRGAAPPAGDAQRWPDESRVRTTGKQVPLSKTRTCRVAAC